ncbi:VOC family protein [Microbacterium sp.]|uniref:VOC family protein n=1 Tax=Microbacterium sp. TaxID=51671 RepID=UPI002E302358|nr:VOC family protein [Microbacterium sp.]HEX5730668.1 VOC family protein [Microbacterium sp.]
MSEQGWRAFLASDGLEDWVVTHGGAAAVFAVGSSRAAAGLAREVAALPEAHPTDVILTISGDRLSVRLTRGVFRIEARHVDLARQISAIARARGAVADRSAVHEVQVAVAAEPDDVNVGFWRAVLGYEPLAEDNAVHPLGQSSTVWMQPLDGSRIRHAMHVDVSVAREHAQARVDAAVAAGGRVVVGDEAPAAWILADRAGNRVCVAAWPDGAAPGEQTSLEATDA